MNTIHGAINVPWGPLKIEDIPKVELPPEPEDPTERSVQDEPDDSKPKPIVEDPEVTLQITVKNATDLKEGEVDSNPFAKLTVRGRSLEEP